MDYVFDKIIATWLVEITYKYSWNKFIVGLCYFYENLKRYKFLKIVLGRTI